MKNIIKAYLSFATGKLSNFESEYEQFIKQYPIGKAEQDIISAIWERSRYGANKYKNTTDRLDFKTSDWIQSELEEVLDKNIYHVKSRDGLDKLMEIPEFLVELKELVMKYECR